ncbi:MAG: sulfatase-like hydrolase/transferase [Akkermansia muciniphila]
MRMTWAGRKWAARQKKIKTPNIDKLASEGQRWVYFYSGAPVCSPSRNVLMTGKHTGSCDVQDLKRVDAGENCATSKETGPSERKPTPAGSHEKSRLRHSGVR